MYRQTMICAEKRCGIGRASCRTVPISKRHALTEGVEAHRIEGETVRVYSVAKAIADAFKYRNKIGLDVALEAPARGLAGAALHHG